MTTREDWLKVAEYIQAQADTLNAQAKEAEIWATMTQAQRRLVISGVGKKVQQ